jgi:LacI family transcriptional regulator
MLNRRVPGVRASITVDDAAGAALATNHLVELGHKKVAGVFGPNTIDTTRRRRAGFNKAARQARIDAVIVDAVGLDLKSGTEAAERIFHDWPEITGIFASTFAIATGVLRAARQAGVRIPEDLSLIALHDSELADYFNPPLTTVRLPVEEMAGCAVDLLIDLIEGAPPRNMVVRTAPVLITRESTRRPRGTKLSMATERLE